MGNEITKRYELANHHTGLGGNSSMWKIFPAKTKATGQPVSVLVFQKDEMMKHISSKVEKEHILNLLRKDIRVLKGLSHPGILGVVHVFDETKKALAFVTEPVQCTLADLLVIQRPLLNPEACGRVAASNLELTPPEKARGVSQILEGLQYLHQVAHRVHAGISSDTIFLTPTGEWKIGGFGLSLELAPENYLVPSPFFPSGQTRVAGRAVRMDPWLRYSAPELTSGSAGSQPNRLSPKTDLFSLGCIMHEVYADSNEAFIPLRDETVFSHRNFFVGGPQPQQLSEAGQDITTSIRGLLATIPQDRPEVSSVLSGSSFHTKEVTVLRTLDKLPALEASSQATFLSSLGSMLGLFSFRVHKETVLPCILRAGGAKPEMWGYILPLVFQIAQQLSKMDFQSSVQPGLQQPLTSPKINQAAFLQLVSHVKFLLERAEDQFFMQFVVPLIVRALDCPQQQIQESVLKNLADLDIVSAIPSEVRTGNVVTKICKLAAKGGAVTVRVGALLALAKTFAMYGNQMLMERIFPTLRFCTEKPGAPAAVLMCCLGCYDAICKSASIDTVARYILPGVMPLLAAPELNAKQFEMVSDIAQSLLKKVLESRRKDYGPQEMPASSSKGLDDSPAPLAPPLQIEEKSTFAEHSAFDQQSQGYTPPPSLPPPRSPLQQAPTHPSQEPDFQTDLFNLNSDSSTSGSSIHIGNLPQGGGGPDLSIFEQKQELVAPSPSSSAPASLQPSNSLNFPEISPAPAAVPTLSPPSSFSDDPFAGLTMSASPFLNQKESMQPFNQHNQIKTNKQSQIAQPYSAAINSVYEPMLPINSTFPEAQPSLHPDVSTGITQNQQENQSAISDAFSFLDLNSNGSK